MYTSISAKLDALERCISAQTRTIEQATTMLQSLTQLDDLLGGDWTSLRERTLRLLLATKASRMENRVRRDDLLRQQQLLIDQQYGEVDAELRRHAETIDYGSWTDEADFRESQASDHVDIP